MDKTNKQRIMVENVMVNMDYVKYEMELFENLDKARKLRGKIISAGKVDVAMRTGNRYQMRSDDDAEQIKEALDELYKVYGNISRCAMNIQQEMVFIKKEFEDNLSEVEE